MPDVRKCAIYGCRSNSRDNYDLKFFNFPARESTFYPTWLAICHESSKALSEIRRPYICSKHFHSSQIGFRRLALGAIPTLLLKAAPGFAEEEKARLAEEEAAVKEKNDSIKLINDCLLEWSKRAMYHEEFGKNLCTARRELQRVGAEIRNLLGATLNFTIDDYWLRKFRQTHLKDWDLYLVGAQNDDAEIKSLDLVEIIKSIDPNANISGEDEIAILVEEEQKRKFDYFFTKKKRKQSGVKQYTKKPKLQKSQPAKNKTFTETLEMYYGIDQNNDSQPEVKSEIIDCESFEFSKDDEGCFDIDSEQSSHHEVISEPIIDTYHQALEHLKPLEDFALRQENYRAIGLLSTLEAIFKNPQPSS